jgi:putative ABC transport system ATP-binding protein
LSFIKIKDVHKNLDGKQILKGTNLEIKMGEIISIVGPSGSGKSTLLRCINRLIETDKGDIIFDKKNIKDINPTELRRCIVFVPQESVMFEGTVFDNISYGLKLVGEVDGKIILDALKQAGLNRDFLEKNAEKLSGGEKKRVALARALALNPTVLMLDEPTSGVDPKKIQEVEKSIISFSKDLNLTVLWVTHHVEQAKRVSDRIANLKDGVFKEVKKTKDFVWEGAY